MSDSKRRIVVKVGTSTLTHAGGRTNIREMERLVRVLSDIMNSGKQVVLVDDVISTGSTLAGMKKLVESAGGVVLASAAALTEGNDPEKWRHVISTGNLPVFLS